MKPVFHMDKANIVDEDRNFAVIKFNITDTVAWCMTFIRHINLPVVTWLIYKWICLLVLLILTSQTPCQIEWTY
jgi:hypothetical protein